MSYPQISPCIILYSILTVYYLYKNSFVYPILLAYFPYLNAPKLARFRQPVLMWLDLELPTCDCQSSAGSDVDGRGAVHHVAAKGPKTQVMMIGDKRKYNVALVTLKDWMLRVAFRS